MSNIIPSHEERFLSNTIIFFSTMKQYLTEIYKKGYKDLDPALIDIVMGIVKAVDKKEVIEKFIENSYKLWDMIKAKDEEFFKQRALEIFHFFPKDKINAFNQIFTKKDSTGKFIITQDKRDKLWTIAFGLVRISIKYVSDNRNKFNYINIDDEKSKWF